MIYTIEDAFWVLESMQGVVINGSMMQVYTSTEGRKQSMAFRTVDSARDAILQLYQQSPSQYAHYLVFGVDGDWDNHTVDTQIPGNPWRLMSAKRPFVLISNNPTVGGDGFT